MAHWKNIKGVGKRCVSNKGKFLKASACGGKKRAKKSRKGGKRRKSRKGKSTKTAKTCKGTYHVKAYHVKAQNRKCPKRRRRG